MIAACLLCWGALAGWLDWLGQRAPPDGTWDAIVVAGCRVGPDGRPSIALQRRTARAVDLWKEGRAPRVLFTGGVGRYPPSEARAAATFAEGLGLPPDAVLLEDASTSTEENARFSAERHGFTRVLVVTDAWHVFRARRVFARYFTEVAGAGSNGRLDARVVGALREVLAVVYYGVTGRL